MFHFGNPALSEVGGELPIQFKLCDSEFRFYLTGSRYFGNTRSDSDWDFFVEHTMDCEAFLQEAGFAKIKVSHYKDQQLSCLMRYTDPVVDPGIRALQIDVQMVRDAGLKERAQAYIFSNPLWLKMYCELSKWHKEMLWDLAYSAANGMLYTGALNGLSSFEGGRRSNTPNLQNILSNFCENPYSTKEGTLPIPPG